jgi:hypothetical protein
MRNVGYAVRCALVVLFSVMLALGAFGAPPNDRPAREKPNPVLRLVKKVIKSLGDGLVTPTP